MRELGICRRIYTIAVAASILGCTAGGPPVATSEIPSAPTRPGAIGAPLVLDPADFRIGTTVQYARIPSASELYDLQHITGLAHVLLTLGEWPSSFTELESLRQLPPEADLIVVLSGYPPSRTAADAWNLVEVRQRLILLVDRPPLSASMVADLNSMRGLERVIVETEQPSRLGFERLQRPLSFRILRD
jgi:hypothetical protein